MLTLDPLKLALVAVVAVVVLGPDKLPGLARRAGGLLKDLQRLRASLEDEARHLAGDLPLADELRQARQLVGTTRQLGGPDAARQALLRAAGLEADAARPWPHGAADSTEVDLPPGSIDLGITAPQLVRAAAPIEPVADDAADLGGEAGRLDTTRG